MAYSWAQYILILTIFCSNCKKDFHFSSKWLYYLFDKNSLLPKKPSIIFFAPAYGKPKPMHHLIIKNWEAVKPINFLLLTDYPQEWQNILSTQTNEKSNILIQETTLNKEIENLSNLLEEKDDSFHKGKEGWYLSNFRPLADKLYPILQEYDLWGWIDWDIFLSRKFYPYIQNNVHKHAMLFFSHQNNSMDHLKLVNRNKINLPELFLEWLKSLSKKDIKELHLEIKFLSLLNKKELKKTDQVDIIPLNQIALHFYRHPDFCTVLNTAVNFSKNLIYDKDTSEELLFFVADREVKKISTIEINNILKHLDDTVIFKNIGCFE